MPKRVLLPQTMEVLNAATREHGDVVVEPIMQAVEAERRGIVNAYLVFLHDILQQEEKLLAIWPEALKQMSATVTALEEQDPEKAAGVMRALQAANEAVLRTGEAMHAFQHAINQTPSTDPSRVN